MHHLAQLIIDQWLISGLEGGGGGGGAPSLTQSLTVLMWSTNTLIVFDQKMCL